MNVEKLIDSYITLRDKKAEVEKAHKTKLEKLKALMDTIEQRLLAHLNDTGTDSAKTGAGTVYKNTQTSVRVADREAFLDFVKDQEAWVFLESKANKTAVNEYLEEHQAPPPGLDITRVSKVNIRRA